MPTGSMSSYPWCVGSGVIAILTTHHLKRESCWRVIVTKNLTRSLDLINHHSVGLKAQHEDQFYPVFIHGVDHLYNASLLLYSRLKPYRKNNILFQCSGPMLSMILKTVFTPSNLERNIKQLETIVEQL